VERTGLGWVLRTRVSTEEASAYFKWVALCMVDIIVAVSEEYEEEVRHAIYQKIRHEKGRSKESEKEGSEVA